MDLGKVKSCAARVIDQVELVKGEILLVAWVDRGPARSKRHHKLHGLLELQRLIEQAQSAEDQTGGSDPTTGHVNAIRGEGFNPT